MVSKSRQKWTFFKVNRSMLTITCPCHGPFPGFTMPAPRDGNGAQCRPASTVFAGCSGEGTLLGVVVSGPTHFRKISLALPFFFISRIVVLTNSTKASSSFVSLPSYSQCMGDRTCLRNCRALSCFGALKNSEGFASSRMTPPSRKTILSETSLANPIS